MRRRLLITLLTFCFCNILFAQEPKLILPVSHSSISSAKYSLDEKKIITSSPDNTNKLWDAVSGSLLAVFPADEGVFYTGQFSSDNKRILTISGKNARIWDATTTSLLAELKGHENILNTAKFSRDGTHIVTVSTDSIIKVWNSKGKNILFSIKEQSYINSAEFSPDGKRIVTTCANGDVNIRDIFTGNIIVELIGHKSLVWYAEYNTTGNKLLTASMDKTVKIWDATSGKLLRDLSGGKHWLVSVHFSPDGKKIIGSYADSTGYTITRYRRALRNGRPAITKTELKTTIWDTETGNQLMDLKGLTKSVFFSRFSNDGKKILTITEDCIASLWDAGRGDLIKSPDLSSLIIGSAEFSGDGSKLSAVLGGGIVQIFDLNSGKVLVALKGHSYNTYIQFSPDRKKIITWPGNNTINIRDAFNGDLLTVLKGHKAKINTAQYSRNGKKIVTSSADSTLKIWDSDNGELLSTIRIYSPYADVEFSPDGKKLVSTDYYNDKAATIWDVETGKLLLKLNGHKHGIASMNFSHDGSKIVTASYDSTAIIWNFESGEKILELRGHTSYVYTAEFSPDDKTVLTTSLDKTAKIWNAISGKIRADLTAHTGIMSSGHFSPDGSRIATSNEDGTANIWDAVDGKLLHNLRGHTNLVRPVGFSPSGEKLITISWDKTVKIWDVASGKLLSDLKGPNSNILSADFYMDETKVMVSTDDNMSRIWDIQTSKLLYSLIGIDSTDFLVIDKQYRYDGTLAARKLLYFTCGTEIIELDQVKDQLWVPNLAERIMKGDSINAKKLTELNICGLTPEVEDHSSNSNEYRFKILPRRGGLGETVLYVNGIEAKRYKKERLQKNVGVYELLVKKEELNSYFIAGAANPVMVKAYTADNAISSRGFVIEADKTSLATVTPNLYGVMIGVSDYKGDDLDLQYAAKDATDISNAVGAASRRLLNTDGKEHVFMYNLTTATDRYQLPEKNSIKKTLEEIGKKATANDILLIFFAGHGVMQGDENKKQFYFLTADASKASAGNAADVGISTAELTEWMKPSNIKAQKRILIFDACNSGQAIRDFVQLGKTGQGYVAARSDEKGQQIKAIEKLNNQSGLFILAASATNQSAYEMGRYSQGLLTYSLLKAIKQQPDILESGKYLDVSNWLNAAKKTVTALADESGSRQEPQLNANNNFNIGLVDEEVRSKIVLADAKPLFARSNFQNTDTKTDNLKLRSAIDKQLMNISGANASPITYSADYEGTDAYSLTGDYKIADGNVTITVLITKGGTEVYRYEIKGKEADTESITTSITSKTLDWLKNH